MLKKNDDMNSRQYSMTYFCSCLTFDLLSSVMGRKSVAPPSHINTTKKVSKIFQHNRSTRLLLSKVLLQLKLFFHNDQIDKN